jgi:hypothetical protein
VIADHKHHIDDCCEIAKQDKKEKKDEPQQEPLDQIQKIPVSQAMSK